MYADWKAGQQIFAITVLEISTQAIHNLRNQSSSLTEAVVNRNIFQNYENAYYEPFIDLYN